MPTKRKRRAHHLRETLSDGLLDFLSDGRLDYGENEQEKLTWMILEPRHRLREAWDVARNLILEEWREEFPGTRPTQWWEFDAPRVSDETLMSWGYTPKMYLWRADERPADPRRRVGGTGSPDFEHFNVTPTFEKGIPSGWIDTFDTLYYRGRAFDVQGLAVGQKYIGNDFRGIAVDRSNPPTFESEAEYLRRHDLLTSAEQQYLDEHSELLHPETIQILDES